MTSPQARFLITSIAHPFAPHGSSIDLNLSSSGPISERMIQAFKLINRNVAQGVTLDLTMGDQMFYMAPPEPILVSFGRALEILKTGVGVKRKAWEFYYLSFHNPRVVVSPEELGKVWLHRRGVFPETREWTPSIDDLFAKDWMAI